jgi:Acylphosphatases
MMVEAYSIRIFGRVFGVGFRRYIYRYAMENNILGFVENDLENECVHIEAEGRDADLRHFIMLCEEGTPYSFVTEMKITPKEATRQYSSFQQIR